VSSEQQLLSLEKRLLQGEKPEDLRKELNS